jgi:hypothetical protein
MFILVGYYLPKIYFDYFDMTDYYSVSVPIKVNKNLYTPCEKVTWTMRRKALVDIDAMATTELILMKGNEEVYRNQTSLVLEKGEYDVTTSQVLPCLLINGDYFYRGIVSYRINSTLKRFSYYTDPFRVEASASAKME